MSPIICKNDLKTIINKLQDYLNKEKGIKGITIVEETKEQVVILVSKEPIEQKMADIWWNGYAEALKSLS